MVRSTDGGGTDVRPTGTEALVRYEVSPDEPLSSAIFRAAEMTVDDLTDVRPLASIIDVEALDYLFERRRESAADARIVAFAAWGFWFVVTGAVIELYDFDGRIEDEFED